LFNNFTSDSLLAELHLACIFFLHVTCHVRLLNRISQMVNTCPPANDVILPSVGFLGAVIPS
jgi:hypothetical protein